MDKVFMASLENDSQMEKVVKVFNCKTRRDILRLLSRQNMSIWGIAQELNIPLSTVSEHVKVLVQSGLFTLQTRNMGKGKEEIVVRQYEKIEIPAVLPDDRHASKEKCAVQIPIGSFTSFHVKKYCGMVSEDGYIGIGRDDPNIFYDPLRFRAQLIWFDEGWLEYVFPVKGIDRSNISSVSVSAEICSEAPGYNEDWKSDISFWINGKKICVYTSPGDFGERRGIFTPKWWEDGMTQYGLVKNAEVTKDGTFLDNKFVSGITLADLEMEKSELIRFRIGVEEEAKNRGGINLFGSKFGDHRQHINFSITYSHAW